MAAGVSDRLWSVEDLVALGEAFEQRRAERAAEEFMNWLTGRWWLLIIVGVFAGLLIWHFKANFVLAIFVMLVIGGNRGLWLEFLRWLNQASPLPELRIRFPPPIPRDSIPRRS